MSRAVAVWMRWIAAAPWAWVLLCGALTLACASGLPGLNFSTDFQAYFSDDNPELQAQRALERHFGNRDSIVLAVAAEEGPLFRNDRLAALRELTAAMAELPWASGSSGLSNFYTPRADGDEIRAEALIPEGAFDEATLAALRANALAEPRVLHGLLGASGEVTAVIGYFELPDRDPNAEVAEVNAAIRALADRFENDNPGLRTYRIGSLAFNQAMADAAAYDQRHLFPLAAALMAGLLWICLRGVWMVLATVAVVLMATGTALGLAGHLGLQLTTASMAAPLIILTLSISDCVHLLASYSKLRGEGQETAAAVHGALRVNLLGVSLTTLTTVIGFLSFNTNASPPFRDLGNLVALGVAAAWVYALVFLPAWLLITRPAASALRSLDLSRLADAVIRHQRALRWGGAALLLALVAAIPLNRFGDNYVKFFGPEIDFRQDTEFVAEHLMGVQYLEYAVPAGSEGGVSEPAYQQRLEAFAEWLRQQPGVRKVSTLNELSKRIHQVMNGDDPAWYRLPETRELAAQYLLLFELALPSGSDLSHLVNFDRSVTRVTLGLEPMSNEDIRQLDARAQAWMQAHWPPEMHSAGTGVPVLFARIAQRNFESMLLGNLVTFTAVALIFMLAFASWRTGLISLIPNFAPMLAGFGLWGLTVGEVGMSLAVVVSLTLGIVVDDSIHFLSRYSQGRRDLGLVPADAIRHAYRDVGAALWITTLALTAGFACLALSSFLLTAHLGLLTSVIIVLALAADLLFLPALLLWFDRSPTALPPAAR
jgi:predicted RND superfamily exporter protein